MRLETRRSGQGLHPELHFAALLFGPGLQLVFRGTATGKTHQDSRSQRRRDQPPALV
jgi:hypothetical protein